MYRQIILMLVILMTGCSADNETKAYTPVQSNGSTLVVFYSYTGDCRAIVNTLTNLYQADVLEIEPQEKGLKYDANNYALGTQLLNAIKANPNEASSYPAIDPVNVAFGNYDNVVVVTPLWWSQMAAPMQTFLFNYGRQLAGKHVALIVSSQSSSIGGVVNDAKRLLPDVVWAGDALWINRSNRSRTASLVEEWLAKLDLKSNNMESRTISITIDGKTRTVSLVDNPATQALLSALQQGTISYDADDYGGFEKVGALGRSLPTSDEQITTEPGDIMLYNGNQLVVFYGRNSWSYTRIGKIDGATVDDLKTFLKAGSGTVRVTLSLGMPTAIKQVETSDGKSPVYVALSGVRTANPTKGVYIRDGRKIVK